MENKVLEAFNRIVLHTEYDNDGSFDCLVFEENCEIVEQALQELDDIKNSNSSDALDCLGSIYVFSDDYNDGIYRFEKERSIIKQYILKAQQQEKVLSIIDEKNVDILDIRKSKTIDDYNFAISCSNLNRKELTQEEFGALKRWANND